MRKTMRRTWIRSLLSIAPSALVLGTVDAQEEVRGRILDAGGRPARDVRVFRSWSFPDPAAEEGAPTPWGIDDLVKPVATDERGDFTAPVDDERVLFALDPSGERGALLPLERKPLEARLVPLVEVCGRFEVRTPGEAPGKTALWISTAGEMSGFLAVCISESRSVCVRLPPGEYDLWYSTDAVNLYSMSQLRDEPLVVKEGSGPIDLGALELELPLLVHPQGVVLGAEGRPVPASFGEFWGARDGYMHPLGGFEAGEDGRFRGNIEVRSTEGELLLLVLDRKRERGALVPWRPAAAEEQLEVRLGPTIRVHGRLVVEGSGKPPGWSNVYVNVPRPDGKEGRPYRVAQSTGAGTFDFRLPPGRFVLNAYGSDTKSVDLDVELTAEKRDVDLGVIELPQTVIARNIGKPALSWNVTEARGLPKTTTLADFRGKWVLLEFWGFW